MAIERKAPVRKEGFQFVDNAVEFSHEPWQLFNADANLLSELARGRHVNPRAPVVCEPLRGRRPKCISSGCQLPLKHAEVKGGTTEHQPN